MAGIESEAAFTNRATAIGVSDVVIAAIKAGGVATFGTFAFCCPYVPGTPDEEPFKRAMEAVLGREPTIGESAHLRRLYYESHALALADMKTRVDRSENDEPKALPAPEREVRLRDQKTRLVGLVITPATQPSNSLVDRCCQQLEDQIIKYIPLNKCASREAELSSTDKERSIVFDNSGHLKVNVKTKETLTTVSSDMQVRDAMVRRALAYDQAGILTFEVLHKWIQRLFECMARSPPPGYSAVSLNQIISADREIFTLVSDATAAAIAPSPGNVKPADAVFERFSTAPEVMFYVLPLPRSTGSSADSEHRSNDSGLTLTRPGFVKRQHKGGKGNKGEGKGKKGLSVPEGCVPKWNGKPICFSYNRGHCTRVKPGRRCQYGFHVCFRNNCFKLHPQVECTGGS
jgi:hypothetical protein